MGFAATSSRPMEQAHCACRRPAAAALAHREPAQALAGNQAHLRRLAVNGQALQAKLTIGAVDDPLEKEADEAADRVMRMADPNVSNASAVKLRRKCAGCEDEEK